MDRIEQLFEIVATRAAELLGRGLTCAVVLVLTAIAFVIFPVEIVNVVISVFTLALLFILQNTANRSDKAVHLKLDELITHLNEPRDDIAGIEERPMKDLDDRKSEIDTTIHEKTEL